MKPPRFLASSRELLTDITNESHNEQIRSVAQAVWDQQLQVENPLWQHLKVRRFTVDDRRAKAHVFAMIDERLPGRGLVGFFGCTDERSGVAVLEQAVTWLKEQGIRDVYGPIHGTITREYRFNLNDDYVVPGEPVNPTWYVDVFRRAGFKTFNRYVSARTCHYRLFTKLLLLSAPRAKLQGVTLRRADTSSLKDFRTYHNLMNEIFPHNSIYCPVITWEERQYNIGGPKDLFYPGYSYFLEDKNKAIGFVIAYPNGDELVLKTIGILPEYRGKGLFGVLIKVVHEQAARDGLKVAIYATIRVGNAVYRKKRPGVRVFRHYVTMHRTTGS
jgi:GNAT superfamily N-acetyltransferase